MLAWITFAGNDRVVISVGEITFVGRITFVDVTETFNIFVKENIDWLEEIFSS